MNQSDKAEFLKVLVGLSAIKPGKELTPEALSIWWQSMQDWPLEDFKAAANHLAKSCEFMPSPYHFEQLKKATDIGKHEAWELALKRCVQHIEHPADRVTRAAQMVGGYRVIGHTHQDQLPFLAKRFMEAYEEAEATSDARQALPNSVVQLEQLARGAMIKAVK